MACRLCHWFHFDCP